MVTRLYISLVKYKLGHIYTSLPWWGLGFGVGFGLVQASTKLANNHSMSLIVDLVACIPSSEARNWFLAVYNTDFSYIHTALASIVDLYYRLQTMLLTKTKMTFKKSFLSSTFHYHINFHWTTYTDISNQRSNHCLFNIITALT